MADIKTILRELSVIWGYLLAKYKLTFIEDTIDVKTYLEFIKKYCKNVNECNSEIQKIEEIEDFVIHKNIIKNGLTLGKLLYEKLKLKAKFIGSDPSLFSNHITQEKAKKEKLSIILSSRSPMCVGREIYSLQTYPSLCSG